MFNKHFGLKKKVAISWFRLCRVQYSVAAFVALLCPSSQGLATIKGRNLWFKDVVTPTPCSPLSFILLVYLLYTSCYVQERTQSWLDMCNIETSA